MVLNLFKTLSNKNDNGHQHNSQRTTQSGSAQQQSTRSDYYPAGGSRSIPSGRLNTSPPPGMTTTSSSLRPPLLGSSLSAPSSPSRGVKSAIPRATTPFTRANICVEKGRIEFVRTDPALPSAAPATSPPPPPSTSNIAGSRLVMGSKIFRPQQQQHQSSSPSGRIVAAASSKPSPEASEESLCSSSPRLAKWKDPSERGGAVVMGTNLLRDRSASPKPIQQQQVRRDSTPPPHPNSQITPSPAAAPGGGSSKIPSRISASSAKSSPVGSSPSATGSNRRDSSPIRAGSSGNKSSPSGTVASGNKIPVQVSPNLVRWRAKLSAGSGSGSRKVNSTSPSATTTTTAKETSVPEGGGVIAPGHNNKESSPVGPAVADCSTSSSSSANQVQLLNLHYEVKRLEETVQTLLPLRHQQSALIQSYEERLGESHGRLVAAEAEVASLKERLAASEAREADQRRLIQQLESERAGSAAGQEQQRAQFDRCLDEIANHVVQALISQKNLQGECRRLRSQVSDLEQRNVALNLLLTQSLRDSIQGSDGVGGGTSGSKRSVEGLVKSASLQDPAAVAAAGAGAGSHRDSMCSAVSDSEIIRLQSGGHQFLPADPSGRPLVSKDSNWTLSSSSSASSSISASFQQASALGDHHHPAGYSNPVERAEKLLAVLKHRLFSAQLGTSCSPSRSAKNLSTSGPLTESQPKLAAELSSMTVMDMASVSSDRPSSLSLPSSQKMSGDGTKTSASSGSNTPSVRALVEVLEKRVSMSLSPSAGDVTVANLTGSLTKKEAGSGSNKTLPESRSPRPPLPIPCRSGIRQQMTGDSPASKDEGYSTMSSDVQVDSSSSSSSFIASGCSSPATLRRSGSSGSSASSGSASASMPIIVTRSLPASKRTSKSSAAMEHHHHYADSSKADATTAAVYSELLEELKEETGTDQSEPEAPPVNASDNPSQQSFRSAAPAGVHLGTLNEDWSPSSAASDSENNPAVLDSEEEEDDDDPLVPFRRRASRKDPQSLQKWTSDSELRMAESSEDHHEQRFKTLKEKDGGDDGNGQHPLRRSRARVQLAEKVLVVQASPPSYTERDMEDWILHSSSEDIVQVLGATSGSSSRQMEEEEGEEEEEEELEMETEETTGETEEEYEQLFLHCSPSPDRCGADEEVMEEEEEEEEDCTADLMDTEFTRDYYRLVKFESNRSLAGSDKFDHLCPGGDPSGSESGASSAAAAAPGQPPPDRQEALRTVLDFIAEQQRYCALRQAEDNNCSSSPDLPHPNLLEAVPPASSGPAGSGCNSTLVQLRHLMQLDEEDSSGRDADEDEDEDEDCGLSTAWMPVSSMQGNPALLDKFLLSSGCSTSTSEDDDDDDDEDDREPEEEPERFLSLPGSSFQGQSRRALYLPKSSSSSSSNC